MILNLNKLKEDENDIPNKTITQSIKQDYANENQIKNVNNNTNNNNQINSNANFKYDEQRLNNNIQKDAKNIQHNQNLHGNDYKNLSTRAYLEMTVVPVVMSGMTELAKEKPENPLEWLGNYILKQANAKK